MNLVIHDLSPENWSEIADQYQGARVVAEDRPIRPCCGCFGCWCKTPGECVVKDGFEHMGEWIHQAEEVTVISRYTYGGFSGFVKNIFDRSLSYVLPQFEIVRGESHHKKRYPEDKSFTFIFYGPELTEEEKESAKRYVTAVCTNIRGYVKKIRFMVTMGSQPETRVADAAENAREEEPAVKPGRTVLLVGSMRGIKGNSGKLARKLGEYLSEGPEILTLAGHLQDPDGLIEELEDAEKLILCVPLYVDGLPAQVIRLLERWEQKGRHGGKKIYLLANMGLYEHQQLVNLFNAVRQWSEKMGYSYGGGLGISAGEMIGVLMEILPFRRGVTKKIAAKMTLLAAAIGQGGQTEDLYEGPYAFPRALYNAIANSGWNRSAKANGQKPADLYRRCPD